MNPRAARWLAPAALGALGAVQTLSFVHGAAWALPVLTLATLVWQLDKTAPRRAALLGWSYGCGWLVAGVWWLYISMHDYGGLAASLSAAAVLLGAAALSLYLALAAALYARWRRGTATDAVLFAALWLLAEMARGLLPPGFPWLASGYAQIDGPLAALAPWVGVHGIGALVALGAASLASAARRWRALAAAVILVAMAALAPAHFTQPAGEFSVALLQTNVRQDQKFAAEHLPQALEWVARELVAARADLVLAPETAVPLLPQQLDEFAPGYWALLRAHFALPGRAALVGLPLGDFDAGYTNSVAGLTAGAAGGAFYRYDKWHLVPFGEFVPPGFRWFTNLMHIPLGDFTRGSPNPPSMAAAGQRVAPNICYEDLFGEELARRFADFASAPTVFANLSNIAWFGDTVAITQHLNISRMRALEFQRPMLRATNTGATAIIDHRGVVTASLAPHTRGVLTGRAEGRQGLTPYAWWAARWGAWPLALLAAALLAGLVRLRSGRRRP